MADSNNDYRYGIPKAPYRALDYAAASLGTILREGPPKDADGFARLADELELLRRTCLCAIEYGSRVPEAKDAFMDPRVRGIMLP